MPRLAAAGVATALLSVAALVLLARQPFSVIAPAPDLRSYGDVPTVLAGPAFYAGPFDSGVVLDQELRLTESDIAIRVWLAPAQQAATARARLELLAGPHGPSLRSGEITLDGTSQSRVARIVPPLRPGEFGTRGLVLLRIAPARDSIPIRVGMAHGATYDAGRVSISGEMLPRDQDIMFEVARRLTPAEVWSETLTLIGSDTLPIRTAASFGPMILAAGLAAGALARSRRLPLGLIVVVAALIAGCLIVLDRTPLSLLPGPDFNPDVHLR